MSSAEVAAMVRSIENFISPEATLLDVSPSPEASYAGRTAVELERKRLPAGRRTAPPPRPGLSGGHGAKEVRAEQHDGLDERR